ncbi:MAG: alpha-L-fucosidase C-terminal domain-containing protein, partial [Bacteroides sp.]|nr:alpha-L-fucosidase C-terminal domain-containing protein [Bacteroides sp.]
TRAYNVYGYGIADIEAGHFGGQSATIDYSKDDIRFTTSKDKKSLYIYCLGLPDANAAMELSHIIDPANPRKIKHVSVLGSGAKLKWTVDGDKLVLNTPDASQMDEIATVFKVQFR